MRTNVAYRNSIRDALVVASLAFGIGFIMADVASGDGSILRLSGGSPGPTVPDSAITAKVQARLVGEGRLKGSDIKVTTSDGVVLLDGFVRSPQEKSVAEADAKAIVGVKGVDDDLTTTVNNTLLASSGTVIAKTERVVSDSWITAKVKSEILANSVSKGFDVNVNTTHGVVVLKGALANQAAIDLVTGIAGKVDGVKRVDASLLTISSGK